MQEINLLENQLKDTTEVWDRRNRFLTTLFVLLLILAVGLGLVFLLLNQRLDGQIQETITANSQIQSEINKSQDRLSFAKSFQAQLKNMRVLLDSHIYWSNFFDEISDFTLASIKYDGFLGGLDGKIHLEGAVENYTQLGKVMLGLNRSEGFTNVKLLSVFPNTGEVGGYVFSIDLTAGQQLFIKPN